MPKIKRSVVVQIMEAAGFDTASALSTPRLEKKVNMLDRVTIAEDFEPALRDMLEFILEAISGGERIEIEDDRPDVPKQQQIQKTTIRGIPGGKSRKFDGRNFKYDWDKILTGAIVVMEQGSDYECKSSTFALQVRAAAKRKRIQVKVATRQGQVIVQAIR